MRVLTVKKNPSKTQKINVQTKNIEIPNNKKNQVENTEILSKTQQRKAEWYKKRGEFIEASKKDPSNKYIKKQYIKRNPVLFVCYDEKIEGRITKFDKYNVYLTGKKIPTDKTNIIYLYKSDAIKSLNNTLKIDKNIANDNLQPLFRKKDRLIIPDTFLEKCFQRKKSITVTMRNGHTIKGLIHSYGIFSIRLQLDENSRIIVMKHSVFKCS